MALSWPQLQGLNKTWRGVDGADISKQYTIGPSSNHDEKHVIALANVHSQDQSFNIQDCSRAQWVNQFIFMNILPKFPHSPGAEIISTPTSDTSITPAVQEISATPDMTTWAERNYPMYGWPASIVFDD